MKSPTRAFVPIALAGLLLSLAALVGSQPAPPERVGPVAGGGFLLNSGWVVRPVGKQIPLETLPLATALSPDKKYLLVLHCGYRPPSIAVLDAATGELLSTTKVPDAWLGLTFSPKGDRVYVGGAARGAVFEFAFGDGRLTPARTFEVVKERRTPRDFVGDVTFDPEGHLLYAADLSHDAIAVINPQSGMVTGMFKTGRRPYRILFHPDGKSFFVTHWADGTLGHYDAINGTQLTRIAIGAHPTDMVWRAGASQAAAEGEASWAARIFVAASNTNNVYTVAVSDVKDLKVIESINVAMTPRQPLGMTPSGLALSPDGSRLYVACSDANAAAVVDTSGQRSDVLGFIPTGWYPTAARVLPSGALVVLNGKGLRSYANPKALPPTQHGEVIHVGIPGDQYVGFMQTGTASWIEPFSRDQLQKWTKAVFDNSPYHDEQLDQTSPLPPIQHVIYIVKENRTYDQVLGDMKQGNGDPSLTLFGEKITPNLHKISSEFVLLDNFYVNADVSADGHNWSTAAISPDYVVKLWPNNYSRRGKEYDFEEQDPTALPPAGYLWTNANQKGVSIRNFGYMVNNKKGITPGPGDKITGVRDPVLAKVTNPAYPGFDLDYPDVERAKTFIAELGEYENTGNMPGLIVMRLGNDHTNGAAAGKIAPLSAAADNDYAVGMIAEAVSKSKFWTSTAIFILEDDAQNGPDHVDSHRSPAYVISAYVKRHSVDSTMYNTTSMLRTMEFLLGLNPMTHFDAAARAMTSVFQKTPDASPYTAEKPRIALTDRNPSNTPAAAAAKEMDFDEADENDDFELNDAIWRLVRGTTPPPPVRSFFGR
jgi:DNA-binding beta-propeller fold protein YncE